MFLRCFPSYFEIVQFSTNNALIVPQNHSFPKHTHFVHHGKPRSQSQKRRGDYNECYYYFIYVLFNMLYKLVISWCVHI